MSKTHKKLNLLSLLALLLVSCQSTCDKKEDAKDIAPQVLEQKGNAESSAIVNGQAIDKNKLEKLYVGAIDRMAKAGRPANDDMGIKIRASLLTRLIDEELLKQKANKEGIEIDRMEKIKAFEEYKSRMGGEAVYKNFKERSGIAEEDLIDNLVKEKLIEKLSLKITDNKPLTEEEIKEHFEKNPELYTKPPMAHAKHILLKFDPKESKEKEEVIIKKVNDIMKELKEPNASFAQIAAKYSECPSAKNGGDLGFFPKGRMVKPFEEAAFNGPLNIIQSPIKTDYGYHILLVQEKTPLKRAELSEVKDQIVQFLTQGRQNHKIQNILEKLKREAKITINDKSLTLERYLGEGKKEVEAQK